jgi:hypothetical protein
MKLTSSLKLCFSLSFIFFQINVAIAQEASQDSILYNGKVIHKNDLEYYQKSSANKEKKSDSESTIGTTSTMTTTSTTEANGTHWSGPIDYTSEISRSGNVIHSNNFFLRANSLNHTTSGTRMHHNGSSVYYDAVVPNWSNGHVFRVASGGAYDERLRIMGDGIHTIRANFGIRVKPSPDFALDVSGKSRIMGIASTQKTLLGLPANALLWIGGKNNDFDNQYISFRNPSTGDANGMYWWSADVIFGRNKNAAIWGFKETHETTGSYKDIIRAEFVDDPYTAKTTLTNIIIAPTDGNIVMGATTTSDVSGPFKLSVNGRIRATEVKVYTNWADFVFEPSYRLRPLSEVESYIKDNGHLPEIPSAKEVEAEGVSIGETQSKLLQKIEELTLYLIEQNKKLEAQESEIKEMRQTLKSLQSK